MPNNVTIITQEFKNGQTRLKLEIDGVTVYRCYSKELKQNEIAKIQSNLKKDFKKVKKDIVKETPYGQIKKYKEKELNDYIEQTIKPMIEAKRKSLNV